MAETDGASPSVSSESTPRKRRNPFTGSKLGGRLLSASQLPLFLVWPPRDYGVLQTTGRVSGKRRRCCVRVVQRDDHACVVAIGGGGVGWLANLVAHPNVGVRIRGGWRTATARVVEDDLPAELESAYLDSVGAFCYGEFLMWRPGRPTVAGIRRLHADWMDTGTRVLLTLDS